MDYQNAPLTVAKIADGVRIAFNGPIHTNVAWLESGLAKVVATKPKLVELDLLNSEHISSIGLGMLVGFHRDITSGGGSIRVIAIRKHTLRVLKLARLDMLLNVAPQAVQDRPAK
jgi:anti-anti-sigma factor